MSGRGETSWFDTVAGVIGAAAARRLCEAFGGARLYVPVHMGKNNPIAQVIGLSAAQRLADWTGGQNLELPKGHVRKRRAHELLNEGDMTIRDIAFATDYTERRIYQMKSEIDAEADSPQGNLFDRK